MSKASVPEEQLTQYFAPEYVASLTSNSKTSGPWIY